MVLFLFLTITNMNFYCFFSLKLPTTLFSKLKNLWPSNSGRDEVFWRIECQNRGTCSFHEFNQIQYFYLAVNLLGKMCLFDILVLEGISTVPYQTPGITNNQNDIIAAIKYHHFGGQVSQEGFEYINCTSYAGTCGQGLHDTSTMSLCFSDCSK
jgi:hypothetical protein